MFLNYRRVVVEYDYATFVTEEESSESKDDDALGPLNFAITAPKEVKQMIIAIYRSNEFVFPTYNGKRHVYPY